MRVTIRKSDNRIIETQSNDEAPLDALHLNAAAAGYSPEQVEIKVIPDAEFAALMAVQDAADVVAHTPTPDQYYDRHITTERLLRAVVLALNDGSLVPGSNKTGAQLKAIIKAKL